MRLVLMNPWAKKKLMMMSQMTSLVKAPNATVKGSVHVAMVAVVVTVRPRNTHGVRTEDEPCDGGEEDGEELPCLWRHINGLRHKEAVTEPP
jgi:hypothetical protein